MAGLPPPAQSAPVETTHPEPVVIQEIQNVKPIVETTRVKLAPAVKIATPKPVFTAPAWRDSAGNTYDRGYCTWWAKHKRPDLPNNLGNAITWVSRAAAQGIPTGSTPRVGAIGQSGNHVVYVEKVDGDQIYLSAMNDAAGWDKVAYRWDNASEYLYIY